MNKRFKDSLGNNWVAYMVATCAAVVLYFILSHLYVLGDMVGYIRPILWGILFAYLLNPLVDYIENRLLKKIKKEAIRHIIAVVLALIIVALLIALLVMTLVPSIAKSVSGLINNAEYYSSNFSKEIEDFSVLAGKMNIDVAGLTTASEKFVQNIFEFVTSNADSIAGTFFSFGAGLANIVIGIILAVYFMVDKVRLINTIDRLRRLLLKDKTYHRNNSFWARCHKILSKFLIYDIIDGIIVGIVNAIFMAIFGMSNITLISVIVGATNLLPTFGPIIGALIGALILVLINPMNALAFLIFSVILQTFDGYIIKPKLFGDSFGLPAVWVLIAIVVGGKMFGVIGILLAIPFAAIITYALKEIIVPHLEERKIEMEKNSDS